MGKICKKCGIVKNMDQFPKRLDSKDGCRNYCNFCKKKIDGIWMLERLESAKIRRLNMKEKLCNKCNLIKIVSHFYKNNISKDGYSCECKKCKSKYNQENRERILFQEKERNKKIETRYSNWRHNAKTRKIDWNLNIEDVINLPLICHYTGDVLTTERGFHNTVSLDRIDSSKCYSKNNIVLCCAVVNYMKLDMTIEKFINRCHDVVNLKNEKCKNESGLSKIEVKYILRNISNSKRRCKFKERDFEIDKDFIYSLSKYCYYTGERLAFESNKNNSASIERIDNNKGYTKDNTALCCKDINLMKRNLTKEEFKNICHKIITNC